MVREVWLDDKKIFELRCSVGISFEESIDATKKVKKSLIRKDNLPTNIKFRIVSKTKGISDWI